MAVEKGMNPPIPGFGDRIREVVGKLANRVGGHGIMQTTKFKEDTATEEKKKVQGSDDSDLVKELIPSPGSSKEPPKDKKPWIQRKAGKLTAGIGLGALALGGAGYAANEAYQNNRPTASRPAETVAPFDNAKTEPQTIKAGINAVPATTEDLDLLAKSNIKPPSIDNPLPEITLLFPGLLQETDIVKIASQYGNSYLINGQTGEKIPIPTRVKNTRFTFSREGTELIPGIIDEQAREIEVFRNPLYVINGTGFLTGVNIFVTRKDGSQYEVWIGSVGDVRSLIPLDAIKDAPIREVEQVKEGDHIVTKVKNPNQKGKIIDGNQPILKTGLKNAVVDRIVVDLSPNNPVAGFGKVSSAINPDNQVIYQSEIANK